MASEEAFFAGRIFVRGEREEFRFFLWGFGEPGQCKGESMEAYGSFAEPAEGAFLCKLSAGWIFVSGPGVGRNFRHTFTDDSDQAEENALAMAAMGVPVLSVEDGNARIRKDGIAPYSITDDECRRREALARNMRLGGKA